MDEATFEEMCRRHDLTFEYADGDTYAEGRWSYQHIRAAAAQLPRDRAVAIWNAIVDTKLVPEARASFYWRVETERAA